MPSWRGVETCEREFVTATNRFDKRLEGGVAKPGSPECADQVATVDEDRDSDRQPSAKIKKPGDVLAAPGLVPIA